MSDDTTAYLLVSLIYLVAALGGYVWMSFTLAKVFERFDEQGWKAWVPLLNQYTLFQLGGVQPWLAFLFVVPLVNVVAYVMYVLAAHRINLAYGKSAGFTVVAALFPPVWTTLLMLSKENPSSVAEAVIASRGLETAPAMLSTSTRPEGVPVVNEPTRDAAPYAVQMHQASEAAPDPAPAPPAFLGSDFPPASPAGFPAAPPMGSPVFEAPPPEPEPTGDPLAAPLPRRVTSSPFLGTPDQPPAPPAPMFDVAPMPAAPEPPAPPTEPAFDAPVPPAFDAPVPPAFDAPVPPAAPAPAAPVAPATPAPPAYEITAPPPSPAPDPAPAAPAVEPVKVHSPWAPSAPGAPEASAPVAPVPAAPAAPMIDEVPAPFAAPPASPPAAPAATSAPAPAQTSTAPEAASAAFAVPGLEDDDEYGETIIVDRRPRITWTLTVDEAGDLPLTHGTVLLGRKPYTDDATVQALAVPDATRTLSKVHARLERTDEQWTITDLNSTNGVMLVAEDGTETLLEPGASAPVTGRFVLGKVGMSIGFTS